MPDVVCMDLNMPGQNGIEATAYLTQQWPEIRVLVLTVSEETADLYEALRVGARGYVLKISDPQEITQALHQVHQGWVVISPAMASRFLSDQAKPPGSDSLSEGGTDSPEEGPMLTRREVEILRLLARGFSNADIVNELTVSENTVKTHVKNILNKLQLKNRSGAASYAAKLGITRGERE